MHQSSPWSPETNLFRFRDNTINGGNPLGTDLENAVYYLNNYFQDGIQDRSTPKWTGSNGGRRTCSATVTVGKTNHMKLAIADGNRWHPRFQRLHRRAGSLISGTVITMTSSGGGQSGVAITGRFSTVRP